MSTASPTIPHPEVGSLRESSRGFLWGVLLSVVLHGLIFWLAHRWRVFDLKTEAIVDREDSKFVDVGLVVKKKTQPQRTNQNPDERDDPANNRAAPKFTNPNKLDAKRPEVPNKAPVEPMLPGSKRKTIGPGPSPPVFNTGGSNPTVVPSGVRDTTSVGSPIPGDGKHAARFFNIADPGKRVVYAIDRSGSMSTDVSLPGGRRLDLLTVAKAELLASLNRLTPKHRFLVIFYNDRAFPLSVDRQKGTGTELLPATAHYIGKMKPRIDAVRVSGSTEHIRALRMAMRLKPDVIYFLTDAKTGLEPRELDEVRRMNRRQGTRIHCIQFGRGRDTSRDNNFLKQLAKMTGGGFRYRNIEAFGRR